MIERLLNSDKNIFSLGTKIDDSIVADEAPQTSSPSSVNHYKSIAFFGLLLFLIGSCWVAVVYPYVWWGITGGLAVLLAIVMVTRYLIARF